MTSLCRDLGIDLQIRLLTDSSTSKAIISRRGLGKVRHIDTSELWLQQKISDKELISIKIKNIFNVSDLATKPQDAATIAYLMELLDHHFEDGRSSVAPQLDLVNSNNGLKPYLLSMLVIGDLCV